MIEIFAGIVSGVVTGLGMGGGTVLIMILSCFFNVNQKIAQSINLIYFIPTAIITIIINAKNHQINFKISMFIALSGIIGTIIGALISINIDVSILRKLFAIFLIIIATYEIIILKNKIVKNKE